MRDVTRGALHLAMQITGSRDAALDILQDTAVKTLEHRGAPKPGDPGFKPWFYRVVRNGSIDWLRSQRKFDDREEVPDVASETDDPERELHRQQRKAWLHKALHRLKPEQREIVCLRDFHDLSYGEIAKVMDIAPGTVMSRLHRARVALRDELVALQAFPGGNHEM